MQNLEQAKPEKGMETQKPPSSGKDLSFHNNKKSPVFHRERKTASENKLPYMLILCVAGLLVNYLGVRLALRLDLPLFLDNIGSTLAAALGGYIPGIVAGFLTNLINGISDYTTAYYGSLTVLISISAAYFAEKGYFNQIRKLPIIIITFSLIGGGLGSVLTWTMYGFDFGSGISAPLARSIYDNGTLSLFWSQFTADMLIDLLDKTITVIVVTVILHLLPRNLKDKFYYHGWQQDPLAVPERRSSSSTSLGRSLRTKIVMLVAAAVVVIALVVTGISYFHYRDAVTEEKAEIGRSAARAAARYIDGDRVEEYIRLGEASESYERAAGQLDILRESSRDVAAIYVCRFSERGYRLILRREDPALSQSVFSLDQAFEKAWPALLEGGTPDPVVTSGREGTLLTVCQPVFDSGGSYVCMVLVDVYMDAASVSGYQFLARLIALFFGFFIMIFTLSMWLADYNISRPIDTMAVTTGHFAFESEEARSDSLESIERLGIHTGDEIENLYHAVVKTTEDMVDNLGKVQKQGEVINRLQNGMILVLADMVESRDKCTGDHVRKTAAYAGIIMRQLRADGAYLYQLTDEFMDDVVNSAPLHDVGKIQVPDSILNKPGKLTDEEFELIKQHTVTGSTIISRAMDMVSEEDSGYLREARNLALYHHERWDGTGYPYGLKGEQIPLSARIMAVADVFDALVSKRSYKEGLSMEKSMSIIREGSGKHFDPLVVKAFEESEKEIRMVMGEEGPGRAEK